MEKNKLLREERGVFKKEDATINGVLVHIPTKTIFVFNDIAVDIQEDASLGLPEFDALIPHLDIDTAINMFRLSYPIVGGQWTVASTETGTIEDYNPTSTF